MYYYNQYDVYFNILVASQEVTTSHLGLGW